MTTPTGYQVGFRFWLKWVLATTIGLSLAHTGMFIPGLFDFESLGKDLTWLHMIFGAGVGIAQWLLLRNVTPRAKWWILASVAGWTAAWLLMRLFGKITGSATADDTLFSPSRYGVGIIIGLAGLFVIRGRWFQNILHVLASVLGFAGSFLAAFYIVLACLDRINGANWWGAYLMWNLAGAGAGLIFGIITGGPVVWILRQEMRKRALAVADEAPLDPEPAAV